MYRRIFTERESVDLVDELDEGLKAKLSRCELVENKKRVNIQIIANPLSIVHE